ncbi:alkylation response protein AidB-like acyl-CoA dehydrogenase [Rhodococcus fascians]|uniref:oxidoreductase n=1 Tax=Nocardiaceae TaxID=85025 RepID=UPI001427D340|nr:MULTISPECIES: oxidoreductase [Rhodococcus]MDR6909397.1 alkylation response protein AidB-like acyl-CoA dehydrogenase [Rhodococcus sp. 3258]MDR6929785.1 alkylation response protein AidB-like acyl-CoA dehydrogenase [Rhodococcus fascians]NIL89683.1 Flavin-dependent monooxygenase, oxygenase subunit HsaA [Rhodococcus fascians]
MTAATNPPVLENHPIDSGAAVLANVGALLPELKKGASENERARRLSDDTVDALRRAGAFRVAAPTRFGGLESGLRTMLDVSAAVAEGDGGASWVTTLSNVNHWALGLFSERAQAEVYADGPDVIISGVVSPTAVAKPVEGGYRVSGQWPYASASLHSTWCTGGVVIEDEDGSVMDQGMALIPRSDYRVDDTWYVAGMRASGSNTVVAEDVFVPEHRMLSMMGAFSGSYVAERTDSAFARSAFGPMLVMVLVGPQLGMGRAALELVRTKAAEKSLAYTVFDRQADSVAFQMMVAEAALKIDTAHLHAYRAADDVMRWADAAEYPNLLSRARVRGDAATALRSINEALNILLDATGAGAFADVNALQRIWRDSNVGARHAVMLPRVSIETYGKALLGVELHDHITPII